MIFLEIFSPTCVHTGQVVYMYALNVQYIKHCTSHQQGTGWFGLLTCCMGMTDIVSKYLVCWGSSLIMVFVSLTILIHVVLIHTIYGKSVNANPMVHTPAHMTRAYRKAALMSKRLWHLLFGWLCR